jgi:hypothetical protein
MAILLDAQITIIKGSRDLFEDAITLVILVSEHDPIVKAVADAARKLASIADIVGNWVDGDLDDNAVRAAVAEAEEQCDQAEIRVLQDAFALVGVKVARQGKSPAPITRPTA